MDLDRELTRESTRGHRAVVAGLVRADERVYCGWSASGEEPDGSALFEIGSITKAFTGVLMAEMVLRGRLRWRTHSRATCLGCDRHGDTGSRRCWNWPRTAVVCRTQRVLAPLGMSATAVTVPPERWDRADGRTFASWPPASADPGLHAGCRSACAGSSSLAATAPRWSGTTGGPGVFGPLLASHLASRPPGCHAGSVASSSSRAQARRS